MRKTTALSQPLPGWYPHLLRSKTLPSQPFLPGRFNYSLPARILSHYRMQKSTVTLPSLLLHIFMIKFQSKSRLDIVALPLRVLSFVLLIVSVCSSSSALLSYPRFRPPITAVHYGSSSGGVVLPCCAPSSIFSFARLLIDVTLIVLRF